MGVAPLIPVVVTERSTSPPDGFVAATPFSTRDVVIRTMTPFAQVLVRGARTYVQSLVGFLLLLIAGSPIAASLGVQLAPSDLWSKLGTAAGFALAPTVISVLQNCAEILARVDESFPKARA